MTLHALPRLLALTACALLTACATMTTPPVDMHMEPPFVPPAPPMAQPTSGAIFNAAAHRPLFEDRRARLVGDTLTVQIEETVSASQQSTTKLARDGSASASLSAVPILPSSTLGRFGLDAKSELATNGDGKTNSTNTFTGVITVTVRQVLPNGNLLVAGEKQIGVNQNVDVLRFSGVVNPVTIRAGNLVSSTQVAEVRLEQRGRGDVGRIQGLGWLSRFFLSVAPV